ncbi:glycosyltransferase [Microthyrium microscopicum]|uniref:Glycosyltransferase n=1 Tax=Microthyrium microscopicum TaxID=703497 RepID=A0A6A6U5M8_9PEZI|nr:glycosyltransferase [Microthyrium microscopicum]
MEWSISPSKSSLAASHTYDSNGFPSDLKDEKILLASESLGPINGVSRTTTNLILSLQAQNVPLKLVAPQYVHSIRRLGGMSLPYTPELSVAYPFRLDRLSYKFKPDLVYLASPASVGFQILLQIRCMINPPVVMANFQTDLSAYAAIIFPSPMDKYAMWMLQRVQGWLYNHYSVHTIFYPSTPVKDYLIECGVPEEKLVHLGRGVDTTLFHPAARDQIWRSQIAPHNEIILVVVGRLAPEKGFPFLATALRKLASQNVPFKLLIVGGNRNAAVEAEVRAAFAPLGERVLFTGFLEGAALARAYASADVFVHCSVTETFGLVVLEAMAAGLPVIARAAGGPAEIVRDGQSGYLTPPDDMDAFVSRIAYLAAEPQLRLTMSTAARTQAEGETWDAINGRVAQRMAQALAERREQPARRRPLDLGNTILNWIAALLSAVWTEMWYTGAMLIVTFFWIVAVLPIMIHGNIVFAQQARRQHTSTSTTKMTVAA